MGFFTENEFNSFDFRESYVAELRFGIGSCYLVADNVKILDTNSKNRDIRTMRTNGLTFRIVEPQVLAVIEEGCKIYNADGILQQEVDDRVVAPEEYAGLCTALEGAEIYGLTKEGSTYEIGVDGEEHAYTIRIQGEADTQEWERFMNLD